MIYYYILPFVFFDRFTNISLLVVSNNLKLNIYICERYIYEIYPSFTSQITVIHPTSVQDKYALDLAIRDLTE